MRRMAFRLKLEKLSYPNAVMCILLGLLMAGVVASGIWLYKKADKPVMRIGNYAITREHLALYQDDLRAKVSSYFYQTYQQDPNEKGFWDSTIGGETPSQADGSKGCPEGKTPGDQAEANERTASGVI